MSTPVKIDIHYKVKAEGRFSINLISLIAVAQLVISLIG
ncbi:hypothetical protein CZ797_02190 [Pseudoalteromonas sp. JB197]|nr:hypothetical protein CZ797_02190 [Pseudoalteromonas sp. JB197]